MADLGLQTWTVRHQLRLDAEDILRQIRDLGLEYIEIAGTGRKSARDFKALCTRCGLNVLGGHFPALTSDNPKELTTEIIAQCEIYGVQFATVMLDHTLGVTNSQYEKYSKLCLRVGKELRDHGIVLSYHCYDYDLIPLGQDGQTGLDILSKNVPDDYLVFELDTFFIHKARVSFTSIFEKCRERCKLIHIADFKENKQVPLGEGDIPWSEIIPKLESICDPDWHIIEHNIEDSIRGTKQSMYYYNRKIIPLCKSG